MTLADTLLRHGAPPVVIAHRGASSTNPENTLPAFRAATAAGASWVEADVQPTADGVPVLLHDDDVDRTTDGHGAIRGLYYDTVAGLDAGRWFGPAFAGTAVPRLADLLGLLDDGVNLLLEIKGDHSSDQLRRVLREIDESAAATRVFLQSFELPVLEQLRTLLPHSPVGFLVERIDDDPIEMCRRLGAAAYNPDVALLRRRPELVSALHRNGIAVLTWTVDEPDDWELLTTLGVDGIITNRPAELVAWQATRTTT